MALARAIILGITAARAAKKGQYYEMCAVCGKRVTANRSPNAKNVCKGCGRAFCVRRCGPPFACINCLDQVPEEVKDPYLKAVKRLSVIHGINLAILLFAIISFVTLIIPLIPIGFNPIYVLSIVLFPVVNSWSFVLSLAIFGFNFASSIVAMSVSFSQQRKRAEKLFMEYHPKVPEVQGVDGTFSLGQEQGLPTLTSVMQTQFPNPISQPPLIHFCSACGSQLEDNMCFNCGAKTCMACGFANTGEDLGNCTRCGNQM